MYLIIILIMLIMINLSVHKHRRHRPFLPHLILICPIHLKCTKHIIHLNNPLIHPNLKYLISSIRQFGEMNKVFQITAVKLKTHPLFPEKIHHFFLIFFFYFPSASTQNCLIYFTQVIWCIVFNC